MKGVYYINPFASSSEHTKMKNNNVRGDEDNSKMRQLTRELLAELFGTYMLMVCIVCIDFIHRFFSENIFQYLLKSLIFKLKQNKNPFHH